MKKVIILGGGITGRIAQYLIPGSVILERREYLPIENLTQSFGTNYLWKPLEGFESIPLKIITHVDSKTPTEESIQRYKNKVGKNDEDKSEWGLQFEPHSIGNHIIKYPETNMRTGESVTEIDMESKTLLIEASQGAVRMTEHYDVLISTIPLNILTHLTNLDYLYPVKSTFKFKPIYVKVTPIPPDVTRYSNDVVYVNYLSDPTIEPYRYCDRFGERHYESLSPMEPCKKIYPGKIWWNSSVAGVKTKLASQDIHCFGRYGAWNPNELVHETYERILQWLKNFSPI